jgi:MYXO-CTERM domain-containing protein
VEAVDPDLEPRAAVLSFEPAIGLSALAIEGEPAPEGGEFPSNFVELAATSRGDFQFTSGEGTIYRTSRPGGVLTVERLAGPGDTFTNDAGIEVMASSVESHLDSRAFEAGHVALMVNHREPGGEPGWMILADGAAPSPPPPSNSDCNCRATGTTTDLASLMMIGLLFGLRRRSRHGRGSASSS